MGLRPQPRVSGPRVPQYLVIVISILCSAHPLLTCSTSMIQFVVRIIIGKRSWLRVHYHEKKNPTRDRDVDVATHTGKHVACRPVRSGADSQAWEWMCGCKWIMSYLLHAVGPSEPERPEPSPPPFGQNSNYRNPPSTSPSQLLHSSPLHRISFHAIP